MLGSFRCSTGALTNTNFNLSKVACCKLDRAKFGTNRGYHETEDVFNIGWCKFIHNSTRFVICSCVDINTDFFVLRSKSSRLGSRYYMGQSLYWGMVDTQTRFTILFFMSLVAGTPRPFLTFLALQTYNFYLIKS